MISLKRRIPYGIAILILTIIAISFTKVLCENPDKTLVPKVIKLETSDKNHLPILSGPPETVTMESGMVILAPGKSVGKHSTKSYEEILIILEGEGEMKVTDGQVLQLRVGCALYVPPQTEHDVLNTGAVPFKYIYVVAKAFYKSDKK